MPENKNLTQINFTGGGLGKKNGVNDGTKKALTREVSKRYQKAGKKEKTIILDELVRNTGFNRKYALHILANCGKTKTVRVASQKMLPKKVNASFRKCYPK